VKRGDIRIVNIEYSAGRELCQKLGIKRLPTVQFFRGGEKLQDFCCPPTQFHRVQDLVKGYTKKQKTAIGATNKPTSSGGSDADFEKVLDQGRSLVQKHLELEAASADSSSAGTPKKRFWNRFRRGNKNNKALID